MKSVIYLHDIWKEFTHEKIDGVCLFFNLTVFCLSVQKESLWAQNPFLWVCLESVQCTGRVSSSLGKMACGPTNLPWLLPRGCKAVTVFLFSCSRTKDGLSQLKISGLVTDALFLEKQLFPPVDAHDTSTESTHGGTDHILGSYWQVGYAPGTFKVEMNSKSL